MHPILDYCLVGYWLGTDKRRMVKPGHQGPARNGASSRAPPRSQPLSTYVSSSGMDCPDRPGGGATTSAPPNGSSRIVMLLVNIMFIIINTSVTTIPISIHHYAQYSYCCFVLACCSACLGICVPLAPAVLSLRFGRPRTQY